MRILTILILLISISCLTPQKPNILKKHSSEAGVSLFDVINLNNIEHVKIRNVHGPHHLSEDQWMEIQAYLNEAVSVNGLLCKPQTLALIFEFADGEVLEGYICGQHINFEESLLYGSFTLSEEIILNNY